MQMCVLLKDVNGIPTKAQTTGNGNARGFEGKVPDGVIGGLT